MRKKLFFGLVIGILLVLAVLVYGGLKIGETTGGGVLGLLIHSPEIHTIVIENGQFNPVDLEIRAGDTVEWVNIDGKRHSVTFEDVRIDDELPEGGRVSYTFDKVEEVRYFCRFHPGMQGSIWVS